MASEIKNAKDGLKTLLENISGLHVFDYQPDSINDYPAAIVRFTGRNASDSVDDGSFEGEIMITVLVRSSDEKDAWDEIDKYMETTGTESIEAQLASDYTWGGNVAVGRLQAITNVSERSFQDGRYVGADFLCRFRAVA